MTLTGQDVVAAWERLEAASGVLGVRRENKLAEEADRLVVQALTDVAVRADLLTLLDTTSDAGLKEWLRSRLLPDTVTAESDPDSFRSHPLVDFTAEQMPIRPSLALVEVKGKVKERDVLADLDAPGSCLAGAPVSDTREWPVDDSGLPLAHIVQLDLSNATEGGPGGRLAELDLPQAGVLQLFHDLKTYAWELQAGGSAGWLVRWVQQPTRLLQRHPELDSLSFKAARRAQPIPAISVPSSDGFRPGRASWERYERIAAHIEDQIRTPFNLGTMKPDRRPSAWESAHHEPTPTSRVGGFGYHAMLEELRELLETVLPLEADDEHFLLFDIGSVRHLEDWFGDCGTCRCGSGAATWPPAGSPTPGASAAPTRSANRASRSSA